MSLTAAHFSRNQPQVAIKLTARWYLPNLFNWIQNTKRNKNYYINSQPYLLRYTPTASVGEDYGDAIYLPVTDLKMIMLRRIHLDLLELRI